MLREEQTTVQSAVEEMIRLGLLPKYATIDEGADNCGKVRELLRRLLPQLAEWAQAEHHREIGARQLGLSRSAHAMLGMQNAALRPSTLRVSGGEEVLPPPYNLVLDLRPPSGRTVGMAVYAGTLYWYMAPSDTPTLLDVEMWRELTGEEFGSSTRGEGP